MVWKFITFILLSLLIIGISHLLLRMGMDYIYPPFIKLEESPGIIKDERISTAVPPPQNISRDEIKSIMREYIKQL